MANEIFTFFVCLPLIFKYIKDMASFLYTWNPEYWNWLDFQDAVYRVNNKKQYDIRWSCGKTKRINTGDLFFLMRLGIEPKGIIGCGY
ncbi:MAG TPA: hypothetical protein DF614_05530, partial [Methylococcaceae bacterium]|nr:hypothetical protein [Methylococcaceae bacterium]